MNTKKEQIIKTIINLANDQNFIWLNEYTIPKNDLYFECKSTGVITKTNWSNLKQRGKIPVRNNNDHHQNKFDKICLKYGFTVLSPYVNYITKVKYKCNKCNTTYERNLCNINMCNVCNNFYKGNKGINNTTVLRTPYLEYKLYFVYLPNYNAYKIGLFKGKYVKSRFSCNIDLIKVLTLPLYKAYFLEQFIINKFSNYKYSGEKFGGYTETFNDKVDKNKIIEVMGASIEDVEPCELLEKLEAANQQPSNIEIY
jgi:hypothetical protein